jgi:hypothetical protein
MSSKSNYKFCPKCGGDLERRVLSRSQVIRLDQDPNPIRARTSIEIVYACLGVCGTQWSLFDLDLIARKD